MKNEIQIDLQPVQTRRASEEIYNQIRQLILDGEIHPGERLPSERKMMDMMHRSRPTIREAMRMLEREGYIKIYSGSSGAVVQEINVDNAVQSLETIIQMKHMKIEEILEFRRLTEYVEYPNGATGVFISTTGEFPGTNRFEIVLDRATILCENGKLSVFELEDSQQHFIDTCPEGFGRMDGGFIDIETDGENPQHDGVLRAFAAAILRGEPLIARGEEGINGLTLSNAMFLSSWLNETVTLPLDEELFYAELKKRIDSSKAKKESQDTVVFNVEGTFGS